jgi:chemotaxis protein methyltransferase CheR
MTIVNEDFEFVRGLVREQASISLDEKKEYLMQTRLARVADASGLDSVGSLLDALRSGGTEFRDPVVEAMLTTETLFMRDVHPFNALVDDVIPAVRESNGGRELSLWSAAASTGQEAYSMAMLVHDNFPQVKDVSILATDISAAALQRAERASYSQLEVNRGLPASMLVKHFERVGDNWQLSPAIRDLVGFRRLNLADAAVGIPPMDIVFLRNVLIYFDDETKARVLRNVHQAMRPHGYLFLGGAETTLALKDSFVRIKVGKRGLVVYQPAP